MTAPSNLETEESNIDIDQAQKVAYQKISDIIVNEDMEDCLVGHDEVEAFRLELLSSKKTSSGGYGINIVSWLDVTHIVEGKIENTYEDKISWIVTLDCEFLIVEVKKISFLGSTSPMLL